MKVARDVKGQGNQNGTEMAGMENGVLFPRLHVKETKTAGPRAPPRNKMALYEQFTVPSHRFVQSAPGANRPNPAALFNAPASCDGRYVYPPYYVSPNVYTPVSFPGQFLGQTLISNTSDTTADSDKSTKCGLAKSKEQSSGVTINNSRTPRSRLDQKPFSAFGKDIDEITLQTSGRLSTSSVTGNATMGGPCGPTSGQKGSNSITGCASKDLRTVTPQQDNLHQLECLVQRSSSMAIQNDGVESGDTETQLCRKSNLCAHGDVYCAEEAHCLQKCSNEGAEDDSRVDCDDNRQSKDSSTSDNMTDLKEVNCFPIRECQTPAGDLSGAHEQSKTSSASAESQYLGENHPRDLLKVVDACQGQKATKKDPNIRDQCKSQLCNNHESTTVASGPVGNGKGDLSDHNSNSSMLDSIHAFEITPRSIVAAIGQKEFWRVRRAILRQQKIFSTQVFELHRLVKVQKLIARSPSVLIEDGAFGRTPVCTSEEQCVPSINPEKLPETSVVHASQDSKNAINKVKQGNKEMYTHSSMPSHPSARGYAQHLACEPRDQLYAAPVSLASFVPGSPSAAWGYPAYPANPYVVGMASHPGGYTCYQQYPLHQLGGPNSVMGIPYPLDVNPVESPDVRGYGHQSHTSAECQAKGPGKFSKYPFQDGLYYSSMMAPVPVEPFAPWARASHSFSDTGRSVGNGSGEEMSAASLGSESGLKQSKQAKHLDVSSNVHCSQESVSRVSVGEDNRPVTQMEQHIRHSKYNNIEFHPPASFSERAQHDGSTDDDKFNAKNWALAADADAGITVEYEPGKIGESQENSPDLRIAGDIENQALSLFPMSSSVSCASHIIKDESAFLSNEQRVRVIKAVPRAAMAASESTADILLSLQRERQQ